MIKAISDLLSTIVMQCRKTSASLSSTYICSSMHLSHIWFLFSNLNSLYSNHLKFIQKVRYLKRKALSLISNFSVSARPWNLQDNCQFYQVFFRPFLNNKLIFVKFFRTIWEIGGPMSWDRCLTESLPFTLFSILELCHYLL